MILLNFFLFNIDLNSIQLLKNLFYHIKKNYHFFEFENLQILTKNIIQTINYSNPVQTLIQIFILLLSIRIRIMKVIPNLNQNLNYRKINKLFNSRNLRGSSNKVYPSERSSIRPPSYIELLILLSVDPLLSLRFLPDFSIVI